MHCNAMQATHSPYPKQLHRGIHEEIDKPAEKENRANTKLVVRYSANTTTAAAAGAAAHAAAVHGIASNEDDDDDDHQRMPQPPHQPDYAYILTDSATTVRGDRYEIKPSPSLIIIKIITITSLSRLSD